MVSWLQNRIWEQGWAEVSAAGVTAADYRARIAGRILVEWGLAAEQRFQDQVVFSAMPASILDRRTCPHPPDNVDAWI